MPDWTDEQVDAFIRAMVEPMPFVLDRSRARAVLNRMADTGITVDIAEPPRRHFVVESSLGVWRVYTPRATTRLAEFFGANAEQYAREHAERLDREAGLA